MGLCLRGKRRLAVLGGVVLAVLAFQMLQGTGLIGDRYYETAADDRSAASHQALWDVGFAVALDNSLLGIGHEHFEAVSAGYASNVEADPDTANGSIAIGNEQPHNDFLSVWISWGIAALLAFLALFLGIIRNLLVAMRSRDPLIRGVAIGCIGGVTAYAVGSLYHNYMDSSTFLWVYAGLSVALARMATARAAAPSPRPGKAASPVRL